MKIVILSRGRGNYSTKRIRQAARQRGHEVMVVDHASCYVEIENNLHYVRYRGAPLKGIDAIVPRIGASITTFGAAIVRQFEMMDVFTTARSIAITRSRDKLRSLQLLARVGIKIPETVFARETGNLEDIIDKVGGAPLVVKLVRSTHGRGVVLAETTKAAKSVMQAFYSQGLNFLVQEFVDSAQSCDIRVVVVGGEVAGAYLRRASEGEFRANLHAGGIGEAVELTKKERQVAIKAAKAMGLAIAGVDIVRSERGPLVLEVNSSPGLEGVEKYSQVDVATKIIEYIENNVSKRRKKDVVGA
jgi:ribosomal protein S6--L-glutamate ligase